MRLPNKSTVDSRGWRSQVLIAELLGVFEKAVVGAGVESATEQLELEKRLC
jgi:hypothetical protein